MMEVVTPPTPPRPRGKVRHYFVTPMIDLPGVRAQAIKNSRDDNSLVIIHMHPSPQNIQLTNLCPAGEYMLEDKHEVYNDGERMKNFFGLEGE